MNRQTTGRMASLGSPAFCCVLLSCGPHWRTVESDQGRFAIEMPGPPEVSSHVVETPRGHADLHTFASFGGRSGPSTGGLYMVGYWDAPAEELEQEEINRLIRFERDRVVESVGATAVGQQEVRVVSEAEVTFAGAPGLAFDLEQPYGGHGRARIYLLGTRMYALYASDDDARMRRFFESFRLQE